MYNYKSDKNCWKDNDDYKEDDRYFQSKQNDWEDDKHKDNHKKEECCCKRSMREALELLSSTTLTSDATFGRFGFIGDSYITGALLLNLSEALALTLSDNLLLFDTMFNGFESCNCDVIRITSTNDVFYPLPTLIFFQGPFTPDTARLGLTLDRISLCDTEAIVFQYILNNGITQAKFENDLIALLDRCHEKCKFKCDECCCNDGICNTLSSANTVSLTAGWLAVQNVKLLGRIGNVLVLIDQFDQFSTTDPIRGRVYFICLDSVGDMNV